MQNRQQAFDNISRDELTIGIQNIKQRQAKQSYLFI